MRSLSVNKNYVKYILIWSTVLLFSFYPSYLDIAPVASDINLFVNLIIAISCAYYIANYQKLNLIIFLFTAFICIQLFSTVINSTHIAKALWGTGILLLAMCIAIQNFYKKSERKFISVGYWLFYFLIAINLISIILFPNGMYEDQRGTSSSNFFLGNYNGFIIYIFFSIILGYCYLKTYKQRYFKCFYTLLWVISGLTYVKVHSVTSIAGLLMLLIYEMFFNYKWSRPFFNIKVYTGINLLFFFCFVLNTNDNNFMAKLVSLFGKDITFTGRTEIWRKVIELMEHHWILGNGIETGEMMAEKVGMVQAVNAHNFYLDTIYKTGLLGLLLLIIIFLYSCYWLKKIENQKLRYFLEAFLGIFMFMCQFEAYNIKFIFFMLTFITMYGYKRKKVKWELQNENEIYHL